MHNVCGISDATQQVLHATCLADWGSAVSWQEELRKLDEELAAGRLSADDYRVRRDQVLSSAVSPGDPHSDSAADVPGQPATTPPSQGGDTSNSESTQVVSPVEGQQQPPNAAQQSPTHTANPTQQPSQPHQAPPHQPPHQQTPRPGGFQPPQQGSWNAPNADVSPPWGGSDLPPITSQADAASSTQGPETFDTERRSRKGKVSAIVAAAVVVLLGTGASLYFTVFSSTGNQAHGGITSTTASPQSSTPTSTTPAIQTAGPLIIPRGKTSGPKTYTPEELAESKSLPEPDRVVLDEVGFNKAMSIFVTHRGTTVTLWAFTTDSPKKLRDQFVDDQQRFGFEERSDEINGIPVYKASQQNSEQKVHVLRAHYVSEDQVIRVQAFGTDKQAAQDIFATVMQSQLSHNPAKQ